MNKNGLIDARTEKTTDTWFTPKILIDALGPFDLDPCTEPEGERPFDTATTHFYEEMDGLSQEWRGVVFANPPYGNQTKIWLQKLSRHGGGGIALVFARTETDALEVAWRTADAMLFLGRRVQFIRRDGTPGKESAAPSVLIAWGQECAARLENAAKNGLEGALVRDFKYLGGKENAQTQSLF